MHRAALVLVTALTLFGQWPLDAQKAQKATKPAPAAISSDLVNLNTATATRLADLPGIGPKTAELIVAHRQKNGPFKKIEEIMNIRGIGEKSFLKLKSLITVSDGK